jgi:hypothetical protein
MMEPEQAPMEYEPQPDMPLPPAPTKRRGTRRGKKAPKKTNKVYFYKDGIYYHGRTVGKGSKKVAMCATEIVEYDPAERKTRRHKFSVPMKFVNKNIGELYASVNGAESQTGEMFTSVPSAQPEVPSAEPEVPSAEPEVPSAEPEVPSAEEVSPEMPAEEVPSAEPEMPSEMPSEVPSEVPSAEEVSPEMPAAQPEMPSEMPSAQPEMPTEEAPVGEAPPVEEVPSAQPDMPLAQQK